MAAQRVRFFARFDDRDATGSGYHPANASESAAGGSEGDGTAMDVLLWLIPAAVGLGLLGLLAFLWALKSGQFDDLDGAAHRILFDDDPPSGSSRPAAGPRPPPKGGDEGRRGPQ